MQSRDTILAPGIITVETQILPVLNILNSIELLGMANMRSGLDSWVYETGARLTDEQQRWVKILYYGIPATRSLEESQDWQSFEQYLNAYEAADVPAMILRDAGEWCKSRSKKDGYEQVTVDQLLENPDLYINILLDRDDPALTWEIAAACHRFLTHPAEMHQQAAAQLRDLWERYLSPEWERRLPFLEESAAAFAAIPAGQSTLVETVRQFTGRDMTGWMADEFYINLTHAIFVPSPHMGPYITVYGGRAPDEARLSVGARIPQAARMVETATELASTSPFEMQSRLEALADQVRLQIVRRMALTSQMSTEEIMDAFDLSKSTASRHLRLLTATNLLTEWREGGAKKVYAINREVAQATIRALNDMLLGDV